MKFLLTFILAYASLFLQGQNPIMGYWKGELDIKTTKIPLIIHISESGKELKTTIDSPMQMAKDLATQKTTFSDSLLVIDASNLGITYTARLQNNQLVGEFKQSGMVFPLDFTRMKEGDNSAKLRRPQTPKPPFNYPIEEVSFINSSEKNTLAGTICLPKNVKNPPMMILINGSGQQNRDSELFEHKIFHVIADDFAKNGIATLRLDDRGIGGSTGANDTDTSENSVSDIRAAVQFLKQKGYKNIGLMGHSEGGIIAPLVAENNKDIKFLVLLAAPGIPIDELMFLQNQKISQLSLLDKNVYESKNLILKSAFTFVKNYTGNQLEKELEAHLLKEYTKNKMNETDAKKLSHEVAKSVSSDWFVYFLKYNATEHLSKIHQPVLALNGSLDCQVTPKENLEGIKNALPRNKKSKLVELEGLNHLFQEAQTGNVNEYISIEQTFSPKALMEIKTWLKTL